MSAMPVEHVPVRWRPGVERIRRVLLTDASLLLILGAVFIVRGMGFMPPPGDDVHPWEMSAPTVWAAVWIGWGVASLLAVPWHAGRVGAVVLGVGTGLLVFWGLAFVLVDMDELLTRGSIYLGWATVIVWAIWRGRRGEITVRHMARGE